MSAMRSSLVAGFLWFYALPNVEASPVFTRDGAKWIRRDLFASPSFSASPWNSQRHLMSAISLLVIVLLAALCSTLYERRVARAARRGALVPIEPPMTMRPPSRSESEAAPRNSSRASWAPFMQPTAETQVGPTDLSRSDTITTQQLYLSNQARRAQKKAAEIEAQSLLSAAGSVAESSGSSASTVKPGRPASSVTASTVFDDRASVSTTLAPNRRAPETGTGIEEVRRTSAEVRQMRR
uniref:Transmembrane protein n=1 Tax=Mycena chlorophos TaxID=658473 RepID=A0ABQ0LN91_MYCCL|nr:predicted protein [Mycena chlorophos]